MTDSNTPTKKEGGCETRVEESCDLKKFSSSSPKSGKPTRKETDLMIIRERLAKHQKGEFPDLMNQYKAFVVGIGGGDCAGKKKLINYIFPENSEGIRCIRGTNDEVAFLSQDFFVKNKAFRFRAAGTDWYSFAWSTMMLAVGNPVEVTTLKGKVKVEPKALLVIEGCHIFTECSKTPGIEFNFSDLINSKIFIDSDADIRLTRRIYRDTQILKIPLEDSVKNYLEHIKFSFETEIDPAKSGCDIIIPHSGIGYDNVEREFDSSIRNAGAYVISYVGEQHTRYIKGNDNQ